MMDTIAKIRRLCWKIEELPASELQTEISVRASNLLLEMEKIDNFDILQEQMITLGGVVVTTNDCSHDAVNQAREESRLYVDENGFGFVWFESCEAAIEARPEMIEEN